MPRHDLKAYETLTARMPQALVDQARQYAQQHGSTVADLLREGLALRLEAEGPDRDTPPLALDPAVLDGVAEALAPRILTWLETAMRGQTPVRPQPVRGQTEGRPHDPSGQTEGRPPTPRQYYRAPDQAPTFDPTRYFVGALCVEQHRYQGQAGSLRYLAGEQTCVPCRRERNARYNAQKRERQARQMSAPQSG